MGPHRQPRRSLRWLFVAGLVVSGLIVSGRAGIAHGQPALRFVDRGDGTVAEPTAQLVWTRGGTSSDSTWADAVAGCASLELGDSRGWRLPTTAELRSLFDPAHPPRRCGHATCRVPATLAPTSVIAWSSDRDDAATARAINFHSGVDDAFPITAYHGMHALCVRAGDPRPAAAPMCSPASAPADDASTAPLADDRLSTLVGAARATGATVVRGQDGFLFLVRELDERIAARQATHDGMRPTTTEQAAIDLVLEFAQEVRAAGAELVVVPVPPKALIYPPAVPAGPTPTDDDVTWPWLSGLVEHGVRVVDLTRVFGAARASSVTTDPVYCRQDSHWSPRGLQLAAQAIADVIGPSAVDLAAAAEPLEFELAAGSVTFTGDLVALLPPAERPGPETLAIDRVYLRRQGRRSTLAPDPASPILLLADSHGLVFHAGDDMHARHGGLLEHLTRALGQPLDLVAGRGAGPAATLARLRRRGGLADRRLVIWCWSLR